MSPSVALIKMFHAAHRPETYIGMPSTTIFSPCARNGMRTANRMNGTSITSRFATKRGGSPATCISVSRMIA